MSKVKDGCPRCKAEIYIVDGCKEKDNRRVVCPICFLSFIVINRKSGLPEGERFEVDIRENI